MPPRLSDLAPRIDAPAPAATRTYGSKSEALGDDSRPTIDEGRAALEVPSSPGGRADQLDEDDVDPVRRTIARVPPLGPESQPRWQMVGSTVRLSSGKRVPGTRFRLERWIGEGGMGTVYEATHVDVERRVALKILKPSAQPSSSSSEDMRAKFLAEARALARVESPYVVDVLDFGELPDGRPFYAMELLEGTSLYQELVEGPLDPSRTLGILRQCCKALAAVHAAGLVHRDVKPDNIVLLREDFKVDVVRLVDFGIAAAPGSKPPVAGTPTYMAPEQIRDQEFDARLDVYALGCVAYEMLTGTPPFSGRSPMEVVDRQLHEQPMAPSMLRPELPREFDDVVLRCLCKRADERWQTMAELEEALVGAQLEAGLTTAWDDLPMPDLSMSRRAALAQRMSEQQPRERKRRRTIYLVAGATAVLASLLTIGSLFALGPLAPSEVVERTDEGHDVLEQIDALTREARLAATAAAWVYPPQNDPRRPTAFVRVHQLESIKGPAAALAKLRATELRREFADVLVNLGDQYWGSEQGRPFAREFYAQALLFDPEQAQARERSALTPLALAEVGERARTGELEPIELEAGEVLAALAERDATRRGDRIERLLVDERTPRSLQTRESLASLLATTRKRVRGGSEVIEQAKVEEAEAEAELVLQDAADSVRDPSEAAKWIAKGHAALAQGSRGKAASYFHRAIAADRRASPALVGLANVYFDDGEYAQALAYARRAVRLRPRDGELRMLLGDAYLKVLRYDAARSAYVRARELGVREAVDRIEHLDALMR